MSVRRLCLRLCLCLPVIATVAADSDADPTFRPYTQPELDKLLELRLSQLAGERERERWQDEGEREGERWQGEGERERERWQDEGEGDRRKGWVTLEPVPWAHSHIQKWEPHAKPQIPSWGEGGGEQWARPQLHKPHYEYVYKKKPSYWTSPSPSPSSRPEIITDDRQPGPWPSDHHPYTAASATAPQVVGGEGGQWVLLSSTKGYSTNHHNHNHNHNRQRSLRTTGATTTVSGRVRAVRLTVLPPADNSSSSTRLSHGGLLEVDNSGQTVDESQREHAAKMMTHDTDNEIEPAAARRYGDVQVWTEEGGVEGAGAGAVMAALGAGALPATVALLMPMLLGRRRRHAPPPGPVHPATGYADAR